MMMPDDATEGVNSPDGAPLTFLLKTAPPRDPKAPKDAKAPVQGARCAADRLAGDPEFVPLLEQDTKFTDEQQQQFEALVGAATTACRST